MEDYHREKINQVLEELERSMNIVILFAGDAGSRSYGWFNSHSDFDVHIIYAHHSSFYLTTTNKLETFGEVTRMMKMQRRYISSAVTSANCDEYCDVECNITGYELKNCLVLFAKSNPAIVHTLSTPRIYKNFACERMDFGRTMIDMMQRDVSRRVMVQSLLNLAKVKNTSKYIFGGKSTTVTVRLKAYLYLLHHLLYIGYIYNQPTCPTLPPLELKCLLADAKMSKRVRRVVFHLIHLKRSNSTMEDLYVPRYIHLELYLFTLWRKYNKWAHTLERHFMAVEPLDKLFRAVLKVTDPLLKDIDE